MTLNMMFATDVKTVGVYTSLYDNGTIEAL